MRFMTNLLRIDMFHTIIEVEDLLSFTVYLDVHKDVNIQKLNYYKNPNFVVIEYFRKQNHCVIDLLS